MNGGNDNYLELLFTAGSFSDFLSKSEYVERLHSYDRRMLEQYQEARRQVEETQSRLEEELAGLEDLHEQTQEEQGKASEKVKQTADSVADYANQIQDAEATIDQLEDMISQQENDIAALQKQYEEELPYPDWQHSPHGVIFQKLHLKKETVICLPI